MAETKLFEINFGNSVQTIQALKNELKAVRGEFENAEIGTEAYKKFEAETKRLTAEIKSLTDATKANNNALGGINASAKFAEGSYGKLKQQLKENKEALDKVNMSGKLAKALIQEQAQLQQKRIDIEKKIPSLFQERIKGAVDESAAVRLLKYQMQQLNVVINKGGKEAEDAQKNYNELSKQLEELNNQSKNEAKSLKELRAELKAFNDAALKGDKEAAAQAAEIKDRIDDLTDSTKLLQGSGVEQLTNSMNMLQEGLANFDIGKLEIAFDGLSAAMKAVPIFLLVEGIKYLIENFEEVIKWFHSFSTEAKTLKQMEKALADLTVATEKSNAVTQSAIGVGESELELMKAKGASYDQLKAKEEEIFQNKVKLIKAEIQLNKATAMTNEAKLKEIEANDSFTESITRMQKGLAEWMGVQDAVNANEMLLAQQKKERSKEVKDAQVDAFKKEQELIAQLEILQNEHETKEITDGKERRERARELANYLRQLQIDSLADSNARELAQLQFEQEQAIQDAKIKLKGRKELEQALLDISANFQNQRNAIFLEQQAAFNEKFKALREDQAQQEADAEYKKFEQQVREKQAQHELLLLQNRGNLEMQFEERLHILKMQEQTELAQLNLTESEKLVIQEKYNQQSLEAEKQYQEQKRVIREQEINTIKNVAIAATNLAQLLAQGQEEQAVLAKTLALVNIAANTGLAISNLTAVSFSPASPDNVLSGGIAAYAKLAAGIVTITQNMVQAKQVINSFEEGGYTGDGNPHEVSTNLGTKPYTYHKSEYVIPARVLKTDKGSVLAAEAEAMRRGISNPAPYIGGFFDGGYTARSAGSEAMMNANNSALIKSVMENMPTPVVKVTDINKVNDQRSKAISVSSL